MLRQVQAKTNRGNKEKKTEIHHRVPAPPRKQKEKQNAFEC